MQNAPEPTRLCEVTSCRRKIGWNFLIFSTCQWSSAVRYEADQYRQWLKIDDKTCTVENWLDWRKYQRVRENSDHSTWIPVEGGATKGGLSIWTSELRQSSFLIRFSVLSKPEDRNFHRAIPSFASIDVTDEQCTKNREPQTIFKARQSNTVLYPSIYKCAQG